MAPTPLQSCWNFWYWYIIYSVGFSLCFAALPLPQTTAASTRSPCENTASSMNASCGIAEIFDYTNDTYEYKIDNEDDIAASGHWAGVKPIKYELDLRLHDIQAVKSWRQLATAILSGSVKIAFQCREATRRILLNMHPNYTLPDVKSIIVTEQCSNRTICLRKFWRSMSAEVVVLELDTNLTAGRFYELNIGNYQATIGKRGAFFGDFTGVTELYATTTLYQMRRARTSFPCMDQPILKARFRLCLTHPKKTDALSNTDKTSITLLPSGETETCFYETVPMSSYLFAFSVLRSFKKVSSSDGQEPEIVIHVPSTDNSGKYKWMLKPSRAIVNRMTEMSNQSYPLNRLKFLATTHFPVWGMENYGLITVGATIMRRRVGYQQQLVLVHEIVHQWVGNLFTIKRWDEICLQEGFTAYLTSVLQTELFGSREYFWGAAIFLDQFGTWKKRWPIIMPMNNTGWIIEKCFKKPVLYFTALKVGGGWGAIERFLAILSGKHRFNNAGLEEWAEAASEAVGDSWAGDMLRSYFTRRYFPLISARKEHGKLILNQTPDFLEHMDKEFQILQRHPSWPEYPFANFTLSPYILPISYATNAGDNGVEIMRNNSLTITISGRADFDWFVLHREADLMSLEAYEMENYRQVFRCFSRNKECRRQRDCPRHDHCNTNETVLLGNDQGTRFFYGLCYVLYADFLPLESDAATAADWIDLLAEFNREAHRYFPWFSRFEGCQCLLDKQYLRPPRFRRPEECAELKLMKMIEAYYRMPKPETPANTTTLIEAKITTTAENDDETHTTTKNADEEYTTSTDKKNDKFHGNSLEIYISLS